MTANGADERMVAVPVQGRGGCASVWSMTAFLLCPVCAGCIGVHVVKPEFTCHHCRWALRANVGQAFVRGIVMGGLATAVLCCAAIFMFEGQGDAALALLERGSLGWLALGTAVYRSALVLTPIRPQRNQPTANSM